MSTRITLYGRPGCHLCDEAYSLLQTLASEFDWQIDKVDISDDPLLYKRFRHLIPVLDIEGGALLYPPITEEAIRSLLATLRT